MLTTLTDLAAKVTDLTTQVASLKPLLPLVKQLKALPDKVTKLQAAAFEGSNQVSALNFAVARLEAAQRGEKAPGQEDNDDVGASANVPPKTLFRETPKLVDDEDDVDARFHPRARIEFPSFDGKEDPLPWLNRCETFFRCQNTPERRRVGYASLHLTGAAQLWYYRLELTSGAPSWRRFAKLVQQRFGPPMTDGAVGKMMLLRRSGSVEEYTDKFLSLACRDADLTEPQLVQMYTAGLVNPLKTDVALPGTI
ncbi:unnamed protein product [Urochloa decumbens]|uniref:Retrotransposon gag domain-containing protein n=1 Tax=Urochloa decumbens TaxID=240449 RepID=A0ABC8W0A7_9POAL